jgi:hypothetical protein
LAQEKLIINAKTETIVAPIIYGRKKRVNEIPELKMAIIFGIIC